MSISRARFTGLTAAFINKSHYALISALAIISGAVFSFAQRLSSNGTEPTGDDSDGVSIRWDKSAIIGVSCLVGGMALTTASLFYFVKRKDPQYTFNLTFKKDALDRAPHSVFIAETNTLKKFDEYEILQLHYLGEIGFMEGYLREYILQEQRQHRSIKSNSLIDDVLETMLQVNVVAPKQKRRFDLTTAITISVKSAKTFKLCEFIAPPLLISSNLYELVFSIPGSVGSLSLSPNWLPISKQTNLILNYAKIFIPYPLQSFFYFI